MSTDLVVTDRLIFGREIMTFPPGRNEPDRLVWTLKGPAGAISFSISRNTEERHRQALAFPSVSAFDQTDGWSYTAWELNSHIPVTGDYVSFYDCKYVNGPCLGDGSALQATTVLQQFFESGNDENVIYEEMKKRYEWWLLDK